MRHESRESYTSIVAVKPPNNDAGATPVSAEAGEPRGVPAWNLQRDAKIRAQIRATLHTRLLRVRQKAETDKQVQFTTLWHHVYEPDRLAETFFRLRKDGAVGVDRVDWQTYAANLEANIRALSARLKRGAYHAKPVRRAYILKMDGTRRPLGITTLEDKLVQRTTAEVLSAIYETDFLDCSYGFRPGRGPHDALDRVTVSLRGEHGSPATFDYLGFTHSCCTTSTGHFCVLRTTRRKKVQAKIQEIALELRHRISDSVPLVGTWLRQVLQGHYQYYGVPYNMDALRAFRDEVVRRWKRVLSRRSQLGYVTWERMNRLVKRWIPKPKLTHPFPNQRLIV